MSEENPSNPATTEEQESLQTQIELFVHPDAKKATTLADAAASPETLAKGLSELLGAESAEDLLRGALNYLSSTVSFAQAERPRHLDTITEVSAFARDSIAKHDSTSLCGKRDYNVRHESIQLRFRDSFIFV